MCLPCYLPIQIQVTIFMPLKPTSNVSRKPKSNILVWPLSKRWEESKFGSHGDEKVLGATMKSWSNVAGDAGIKTITSGHYYQEIYLRGNRQWYQVAWIKLNPWCTAVKSWWINVLVQCSQSLRDNICGDYENYMY